jgi:hypothetical protein
LRSGGNLSRELQSLKIVRCSDRDFDIYQTPGDRQGMPTERLSLGQLTEVSRRCLDAPRGLGSDCPTDVLGAGEFRLVVQLDVPTVRIASPEAPVPTDSQLAAGCIIARAS